MTTPAVLTANESNFTGGATFGTTVTAAGSANTKGSYATLIASTARDSYGIWVAVFGPNVDAADNRVLLDIAVGAAAAEQVVVPNLLSGHKSSAWHSPIAYFPLFIASGSRVSARIQAAVASRTQQVAIWLFGAPVDGSNPPPTVSAIEALGVNTGTSGGTQATPGVGAEGAWVSLGSVTTDDGDGLVVIFSGGGDTAIVSQGWTGDVGTGGTGSETEVLPERFMRNVAGGDYVSPPHPTYLPLNGLALNVGTQLNARVRAPAADGPYDVAAYILKFAAVTNATPTPSTVAAVASVPAPTVQAAALVAPSTVAAVAAVPAPTIQGAAVVAPATVAATAAVPAPTVAGAAITAPATVAAVAAVPAPTVQVGGNATTSPATVAGIAAIGAPTVAAAALTAPSTVAAVAAVPAPTVRGTAITTPSTVAAVAAVPAPTVQVGGNATTAPATVAGIASVPAPTVSAAARATPATVAAIAAVPAPTVQVGGSATAAPATVAGVASVPAPTISGTARPTPATVTAVASVPGPAVLVGGAATAAPATVAALAAVPTPTVSGTARVSPATVAAVAAVPSPTVLGGALRAPTTVAAVASVPAPLLRGTAIASPATVAVVAAVPAPSLPGVFGLVFLSGGDVPELTGMEGKAPALTGQ